MKKTLLLSLLFLAFSQSYANQGDEVLSVSRTASSFSVSLPANASTGYQWSLTQIDAKCLSLTDQHYIASKADGRVGVGGLAQFTFQRHFAPACADRTQLTFSYARPWEHSVAEIRNIRIEFR